VSPGRGAPVPLLDVNVLIALAWPNHVHHRPARHWFDRQHRRGWATTPVTETGFVRVSSNRAVIRPPTSPAVALDLLRRMTSLPGHAFWPDDVALVTAGTGDPDRIATHRDVTDAHLLALAERHRGRLATFDARMRHLIGEHDDLILLIDPQHD
jgi:toxin-antitoxin system PIN domain toxin